MMKFRTIAVMLAVLAFGLAGCQLGSVSIDRAAGTLTVSLTESEVNTAIQAALSAKTNPLLRDPAVDLQAGTIVINGQHTRRDNSGQSVSGSVVLVPSVVDNRLSITVSAVNIEGLPVSDQTVQDFANKVADRINAALQRTVRVFNVTSISVGDTQLDFVLERAE
ncbi:MAG: hypothetical protein IPK52_25135 [Chloroflexi bacterium]|nr:hypothetical protein [Chloroflexota bacterium]